MMSDAASKINQGPLEIQQTCFHCGLPLNASELVVEIDGEPRPMCCSGCEAVASAIVASGNSDYYRMREDKAATGRDLVPEFLEQVRVYDHPAVQRQFVHRVDPDGEQDLRQVSLILEGIVCAACIWLNEKYLQGLPGVVSVSINYSTHRANVEWDDKRVKLSEILQAISSIGYLAHPYDPATQQQVYDNQRKALIRRIGIAGLFGMQVMMFALALYGGDWWGISESFKSFFRWVSLILTLPIIGFSAQPFFKGAWTDLKHRRAGMDVPVALGMSLAFGASCYHTWTGQGEVYFDSVAMFAFLLLTVRLFELSARKRSAEKIESLTNLTPTMTHRLHPDGSAEVVPTVELELDDRFMVKPGEVIPTDGVLVSAHAMVDEALLTGEQHPIPKQAGDVLIGGSYNLEQPIELEVHRLGQDTVLSGIKRLIEKAQGFKPDIARLADKVASWFVMVLLLLVTAAGIAWWQIDPDRVLAVLVATLVVTCPCALSLATPASLSAAIGGLTRHGMLVANARALEVMPAIDTLIFDKTGTLTTGELALESMHCADPGQSVELRRVASSLEQHSEHPVARALVDPAVKPLPVDNLRNHPGEGVSGHVDGQTYYIGKATFVARYCPLPDFVDKAEHQVVYLGRDGQWLASFAFSDPLKPDALQTVRELQRQGISIRILSGDREDYVASVAKRLGIDEFDAGQMPEQKLKVVEALQQAGHKVAMIGDGINDAPVLAAADLSISMSVGADLARASSDLIVNGQLLGPVSDALRITRKTMAIIRQNFTWAISYNTLAVPFAMAGLVPPWLAAIGMSLSSLIVVLNALRLR
jgi:Cu2+-exporting ATPase